MADRYDQKPTAESIQKEVTHLEGVWGDGLKEMETAASYYYQWYNIWEDWEKANPDRKGKRPQYHDGQAPALIDDAVDAQLAAEPQFSRHNVSDSDDSKKKAERVEKGLGAVFSDAALWNPNFSPKVNGKQLWLYNYTQLYTGLDEEALARPEKKTGESQEDFDKREWVWS
ncbi:MAG: hypothetical protein IID50_04300, partial [Proteobacteria bacterium]|nr:hypothetical protein [Pseudomonadota bacterium]